MISSEPGMRRRRSSESGVGTIRSWSPLTMSVVAVIRDRSEGAERPYFLMASSCVRNIPIPTVLSRSTVRSCKRCMNSFAGGLTRGVAVEEQKFLRVRSDQRRAQKIPICQSGNIVDVFASTWAGAGKHELADQAGVREN